MLKLFRFLFFIFVIFGQVFAQTSLNVAGTFHSEIGVFTKDWKTFSTAYNWLRLDLDAKQNAVQLHSRIEFWYNGLHSAHDSSDSPFGTPLREFQIYFPVKSFDIRVGKQLILWGTTDELNPTDVINPENYYEFALPVKAERKIPTLSAKIDWYSQWGKLTGVYVPFFTPDYLPSPGDPWEVPLLAQIHQIQPDIYALLRSKNEAWRTGHPQFAFKYSNSIKSTDFSLSYYNGIWSTPAFRFRAIFGPPEPRDNFFPEYLEYQMVGGDFQAAWRAYTFRGEMAYYTQRYFQETVLGISNSFPVDITKKPELYGIFGVDRFLFQTWYVNLQFGIDHIYNYSKSIARDETWYLGSATIRKQLFREKLQLEGAIFGNVVNQDYFTRLSVTYKIQDALHLSLLGNLIGSDAQKFIGQYKDHDQVSVRIEYFF